MNSDRDTLAGGLPHSEIPGSPIARISPGLFAACHVLHRLSVPRHPPDALLFALDHRIAVTGDAAPPPRTGPSPMPAPAQAGGGGLYEDTSLGHTRRKLCSAPPRQAKPRFAARAGQALLAPACPPRSHHNSLFTLQSTPRRGRPRRCQTSFSERRTRPGFRRFASGASRSSSAAPVGRQKPYLAGGASRRRCAAPVARRTVGSPVVEVNGFEPMTSCLQSRRSPS